MHNDNTYNKKFIINIIISFIIVVCFINLSFFSSDVAFAVDDEELEQEFENNISNILDDIDSRELDSFIINDFNLDFLSVNSFKDLAIKILSGTYFDEYDSLLDAIIESFKNSLKDVIKIFLVFLLVVLLYAVFKNFCIDKYAEFKSIIKIIFSLIIVFLLLNIFKDVSVTISNVIEKMFSFAKILFPILLNLILLSGASGTFSVYSSLSLILINSGTYLFTYILLPISISIFILSIFGSVFSTKRFSKIIDIFKSIFKYMIIVYFSIFGLFSSINLITSGVRDGVSIRLTKYAIKNYIPIIGGYVSQGFDFIHSCSIVIKNAFGLCGILALVFVVAKPLIIYFVYMFLFKILSATISLIGEDYYSGLFDNVSKTISYFIILIVGLFFIIFVFIYLLIVSVSVV